MKLELRSRSRQTASVCDFTGNEISREGRSAEAENTFAVFRSWGLEETENEWRGGRDGTRIRGAKNVPKSDGGDVFTT